MQKILRAALGAIFFAAVWGPPAAAHYYDARTVGVWQYEEPAFKGRVWSDEDPCMRRRLVKIQELDDSSEDWETVAKTRSDKEGAWTVDVAGADGAYRHVVRPRSVVKTDHVHECGRFASEIEPV